MPITADTEQILSNTADAAELELGSGGATTAEILAAFKADPDFGTTGLIADAAEILKVPRAAVAMNGGDDFAWNAVTDTAGKLTLNITEEEV
jgi:hypothetical protein